MITAHQLSEALSSARRGFDAEQRLHARTLQDLEARIEANRNEEARLWGVIARSQMDTDPPREVTDAMAAREAAFARATEEAEAAEEREDRASLAAAATTEAADRAEEVRAVEARRLDEVVNSDEEIHRLTAIADDLAVASERLSKRADDATERRDRRHAPFKADRLFTYLSSRHDGTDFPATLFGKVDRWLAERSSYDANAAAFEAIEEEAAWAADRYDRNVAGHVAAVAKIEGRRREICLPLAPFDEALAEAASLAAEAAELQHAAVGEAVRTREIISTFSAGRDKYRALAVEAMARHLKSLSSGAMKHRVEATACQEDDDAMARINDLVGERFSLSTRADAARGAAERERRRSRKLDDVITGFGMRGWDARGIRYAVGASVIVDLALQDPQLALDRIGATRIVPPPPITPRPQAPRPFPAPPRRPSSSGTSSGWGTAGSMSGGGWSTRGGTTAGKSWKTKGGF